jgi:uncharacterized membrane protein YsdA (DUF1294 family)
MSLVGALAAVHVLPVVVPVAILLMSVVAFVVYRLDKSAAIQGKRRVPESTLHLLSLVGGWPGALVAQRLFRHKTTKKPFRVVFWLTVAANSALLTWLVLAQPFHS